MKKTVPKEVLEKFDCYTPLEAPEGMSEKDQILLFRRMRRIREFDTQVKDLWMENKIYGLAHSYVGAEAIATGACHALEPTDAITSTHRGHGHVIAKGGDINKMMAELFGKYEGYNHGKGGSMHIADVKNGMLGATGIVGSGMPLAVGSALAAERLGNGKVTICFHGDGGSNQGVWHESVNMAAAWNLPVIFVIENNQMAIGTELGVVTKMTDLYKRADAYGIPGFLADGFNVFAVYDAVKKSVDRARNGDGPSIVEARHLRLLGHFVADDQWYRDLEAVEPFWLLDPIVRMRAHLTESGILDVDNLKKIEDEIVAEIAASIVYASEECTVPPLDSLYTNIYANDEIID
ncbi:MAG: thiamine pyrophosphate-dependent dehydrogenase E1 component subunit alpha [Spirochaetales bacterium]|jgi:acetoin:2,6-dichlorophenolindophenol oxidoreductase subunit alpha|nr:thiamine pyrophosphate-dependent dehydrogenase E1 component subunit alpha [Spirochaetales bacterium]